MLLWLFTVVGLLSFYNGFFPSKDVITGINDVKADMPAQFDKLVFVVIDALRSDLIFGKSSNFKFLHSLVNSGNCIPLTGFSNPPTVTLPRLKGLTTGGTPNFLDAVLNIAETDNADSLGDTWINQLKNNDKRIHMYGDDTWLSLFPTSFDKFEGVSSFFVSDYTQVDLNVTRHLEPELENADWDALILHYLGLDHIGHKGGPLSPLMGPKQTEMDAVIRKIYESMGENTLLVVTGDHGMNEIGNHGGSSAGETSAGLAFISKRKLGSGLECPINGDGFTFYSMRPQVDIVPTISLLMGVPVPQNSLGIPIKELIPEEHWDSTLEYMCSHLQAANCDLATLKSIQETRMEASTEYKLPWLCTGLGIMAVVVIASFFQWIKCDLSNSFKLVWLLVVTLYAASMFGSSTVEEEHQFWYWGFGGLVGFCILKGYGTIYSWSIIMIGFRLMRAWKVAGQKWIGPDSYDISLYVKNHNKVRVALTLLQYAVLFYKTSFVEKPAVMSSLILKLNMEVLSGEMTLPFEFFASDHTIVLARSTFAVVGLGALLGHYRSALEVLLVTQTRMANIPLFLIFGLISSQMGSFGALEPLARLFLQYSSFFATGGSNSLASVDLSNAYNGITSYNIPLVAVLTFLSNWAGPLYWTTTCPPSSRASLSWFYTLATFSISLACFILREHLFVWTVFSPKLLYAGVWLVMQFGVQNVTWLFN